MAAMFQEPIDRDTLYLDGEIDLMFSDTSSCHDMFDILGEKEDFYNESFKHTEGAVGDVQSISPLIFEDDSMDISTSPSMYHSDSSDSAEPVESGSILDQLHNGGRVNNQYMQQSSPWMYYNPSQQFYHAPPVQYAASPFNMVYPYTMYHPYASWHPQQMFAPQSHPHFPTRMAVRMTSPVKSNAPVLVEESSSNTFLDMTDAEFKEHVSKNCDLDQFEELNSRRHKVIDELKGLEQELYRARDETLKSYSALLEDCMDVKVKKEKLDVVRQKVENSIKEVRSHAETKISQMLSAPKKRHNRKLPDAATAILQQWFSENTHYPYPGVEEKARLQKETQLTMTQINNWFINKRGRALKPERKNKTK
ncbi:hypothetical protein AKO1_015233 [Acrasis kona]|uniref:Homeobox domain-containing protein n=1 Tax=Acrasis kona TaxID=1008807 RepID=A0AAW2ZGV3_9EUKA